MNKKLAAFKQKLETHRYTCLGSNPTYSRKPTPLKISDQAKEITRQERELLKLYKDVIEALEKEVELKRWDKVPKHVKDMPEERLAEIDRLSKSDELIHKLTAIQLITNLIKELAKSDSPTVHAKVIPYWLGVRNRLQKEIKW